eukprot:TRINITY_DN57428_c0_g1_i1.p2 TRINITY_DN57428_c0_g1~~TRINITY_DN57428_c0_g1_i1.p2  ORF type:complete len:120 (+),score=17.38 TRINITY_DN57428_c0_g1_i1:116-475(+)
MAQERGIGVIAATAFNSGILVTGADVANPVCHYRPATPEEVQRTKEISRVCDQFGVPLAAAALQFALRHPVVSSLVTGFGSAQEVRECTAWMAHEISPRFWEQLGEQGLIHPSMVTNRE